MADAAGSIYLRMIKVNGNEQGGNNSITLHWAAKSHILAMDLMKRQDCSIAPDSVANSELFGSFDAQFFARLCSL